MSGLTILGMLNLVHKDHTMWYAKFIAASLCLGMWYIVVDMNRQRGAQMDLIYRDEQTPAKLRSEIRAVNTVGTAFIFISVTVYLGLFDTTANQTMRLLGIRHEHATVYVREAWSNVLADHGITGSQTVLKPYTTRYGDVTVALSNFGSTVSLEFHGNGVTQLLRIPAAEVLIDPLFRSGEQKSAGSINDN